MTDTQGVILIRTMYPDQRTCEFAEHLRDASGARVLLLIDNRRGAVVERREDWLLLDDAVYHSLDLYLPPDVGWRCGDYGLYVARKALPDAAFYWMIEDDLRIDGNVAEFFRFFADRADVDFLTTRLVPAPGEWYWHASSVARNVKTFACLFSITRSSGLAVDHFYATRRRHSRQHNRRLLWPNDEASCATTAMASGLVTRDINGFGRTFYDDDGYSLTGSKRLASPDGPPRLLHPVAAPDAIDRNPSRNRYSGQPTSLLRLRRALARRLNAVSNW